MKISEPSKHLVGVKLDSRSIAKSEKVRSRRAREGDLQSQTDLDLQSRHPLPQVCISSKLVVQIRREVLQDQAEVELGRRLCKKKEIVVSIGVSTTERARLFVEIERQTWL